MHNYFSLFKIICFTSILTSCLAYDEKSVKKTIIKDYYNGNKLSIKKPSFNNRPKFIDVKRQTKYVNHEGYRFSFVTDSNNIYFNIYSFEHSYYLIEKVINKNGEYLGCFQLLDNGLSQKDSTSCKGYMLMD